MDGHNTPGLEYSYSYVLMIDIYNNYSILVLLGSNGTATRFPDKLSLVKRSRDRGPSRAEHQEL